MEAKSIFKSRTFWLAIAQSVAGVIAIFATNYPDVGALVILKSIVDVTLRYLTVTPIK